MTFYRKSRRPFTEAEELMWHHLTVEANQVVPVEPLDTNDAERTDTDGPWFEVGPIFLVNETRDKFRVAVFDAGIGGDE